MLCDERRHDTRRHRRLRLFQRLLHSPFWWIRSAWEIVAEVTSPLPTAYPGARAPEFGQHQWLQHQCLIVRMSTSRRQGRAHDGFNRDCSYLANRLNQHVRLIYTAFWPPLNSPRAALAISPAHGWMAPRAAGEDNHCRFGDDGWAQPKSILLRLPHPERAA